MSDTDEDGGNKVKKQVKFVILGETNVGKTSFVKRFCYDEFSRYYNQTVGADFYLKRISLPGRHEINIRISDIGGFEFKGCMLQNYLFNADIIILMYDISNSTSFDYLSIWLNEIDKLLEKRPMIAVVGNKCDVEHHRNVKASDVREFVTTQKLYNFLVSSKTGEEVKNCFLELAVKHLGIPLTKSVREQPQTVVKAEIMPPSARVPVRRKSSGPSYSGSKTSICSTQ